MIPNGLGVIRVHTVGCARCGAMPDLKERPLQVVRKVPAPPPRRRGRPISPATQFKLTHRWKCIVCGSRMTRAELPPGPSLDLLQIEVREADFFDDVSA